MQETGTSSRSNISHANNVEVGTYIEKKSNKIQTRKTSLKWAFTGKKKALTINFKIKNWTNWKRRRKSPFGCWERKRVRNIKKILKISALCLLSNTLHQKKHGGGVGFVTMASHNLLSSIPTKPKFVYLTFQHCCVILFFSNPRKDLLRNPF